jgi:hypothetical protein
LLPTAARKRAKCKPWEFDYEDNSLLPGIAFHKLCFDMLCDRVNLSPKTLFRVLDKLWDPFAALAGGVKEVDYGRIVHNQGQEYEIVSGDPELVSCPRVFIRVCDVHIQCHASYIGVLPGDIFRIILSYVREEDYLFWENLSGGSTSHFE